MLAVGLLKNASHVIPLLPEASSPTARDPADSLPAASMAAAAAVACVWVTAYPSQAAKQADVAPCEGSGTAECTKPDKTSFL